MRSLVRTGRDHHAVRVDLTARRLKGEAAVGRGSSDVTVVRSRTGAPKAAA